MSTPTQSFPDRYVRVLVALPLGAAGLVLAVGLRWGIADGLTALLWTAFAATVVRLQASERPRGAPNRRPRPPGCAPRSHVRLVAGGER